MIGDHPLQDRIALVTGATSGFGLACTRSLVRAGARVVATGRRTDRLAALAAELTALGARVDVLEDGIRIDPAPLHGGVFRSYDDHRLATAAAVIGLVVPGVLVEDIATTAKTLPAFPDRWRHLLEGGR